MRCLVLAALLLIATFVPAHARPCLPFPVFEASLARDYGEHLAYVRNTPSGLLLFFGSIAGTWTMARADTLTWKTCFYYSGQGWHGADSVFPTSAIKEDA